MSAGYLHVYMNTIDQNSTTETVGIIQ